MKHSIIQFKMELEDKREVTQSLEKQNLNFGVFHCI